MICKFVKLCMTALLKFVYYSGHIDCKMLESCPRKHMILAISVLAVVTIFVLLIESRWTVEEKKSKQFVIENNSTCWLREEYEIIKDCHPCTEFEIASKSLGVCIHTHNKEILRCKSGETVTRSCDKVAWRDQRNFWIFEGVLSVVFLISYTLSYLRQRTLDKRTIQKIQKQLHQEV